MTLRMRILLWLDDYAPAWLARWWYNRVLHRGRSRFFAGYCPHGWKTWQRRGGRGLYVVVTGCRTCDP